MYSVVIRMGYRCFIKCQYSLGNSEDRGCLKKFFLGAWVCGVPGCEETKNMVLIILQNVCWRFHFSIQSYHCYLGHSPLSSVCLYSSLHFVSQKGGSNKANNWTTLHMGLITEGLSPKLSVSPILFLKGSSPKHFYFYTYTCRISVHDMISLKIPAGNGK